MLSAVEVMHLKKKYNLNITAFAESKHEHKNN